MTTARSLRVGVPCPDGVILCRDQYCWRYESDSADLSPLDYAYTVLLNGVPQAAVFSDKDFGGLCYTATKNLTLYAEEGVPFDTAHSVRVNAACP